MGKMAISEAKTKSLLALREIVSSPRIRDMIDAELAKRKNEQQTMNDIYFT